MKPSLYIGLDPACSVAAEKQGQPIFHLLSRHAVKVLLVCFDQVRKVIRVASAREHRTQIRPSERCRWFGECDIVEPHRAAAVLPDQYLEDHGVRRARRDGTAGFEE